MPNNELTKAALRFKPVATKRESGFDPFAPRGKVIGSYKDRPIHETLTHANVLYQYDGIAYERAGRSPLDQLKSGQLMVAPGLIYSPVH